MNKLEKEIEKLKLELRELRSLISKNFNGLQGLLESFDKRVAEEVSLHIVGESYYRWDSVMNYFPTLVFLFREEGVAQRPRRVQVKVRLKERNDELKETDIKALKDRVEGMKGVTFTYGSHRVNYVSADRRYKTNIFCSKPSEGRKVLEAIGKVLQEPFDEKNTSVTLKSKRLNYLRRNTPLEGIPINTVSYNEEIRMGLFKVVLLVNGLDSPVILHRNYK